jgi:hypothetical protein
MLSSFPSRHRRRSAILPVAVDILVLNSGEWLLGAELAASPWHLLIYRQRSEPRNELHLWLPRQGIAAPESFACKRYWVHVGQRWCLETGPRPGRENPAGATRLRFSSDSGKVLWVEHDGAGLADLTERDLRFLFSGAVAGTFSGL